MGRKCFRIDFHFSSADELLISDLIDIFVFWEIIQVTKKLLQEIGDIWWDT